MSEGQKQRARREKKARDEGWRGSSAVRTCTVLADTRVWFLAPWSDGSQLPVTLALGDLHSRRHTHTLT